jgi:hypothetical protein
VPELPNYVGQQRTRGSARTTDFRREQALLQLPQRRRQIRRHGVA